MTQTHEFYHNQSNAQAYAHRCYQETYYLIERCLGEYFQNCWTPQSIKDAKAIDYGCGTGSSTRLFHHFGFKMMGIDPSIAMIQGARELDPDSDYYPIDSSFDWDRWNNRFDLVSSSFVLPVLATEKEVNDYLHQGYKLLNETGTFIVVTAGQEAFDPVHSWVSWSQDFPENKHLQNGAPVKGYLKKEQLLLEDTLWTKEFLKEAFAKNKLHVEFFFQPLGQATDPFSWMSEATTSPFEIYVLKKD